MRIKRVVRKVKLGEQADADREFWRNQTPGDRLAAVTFMINTYFGLTDEAPDRVQRVLTVSKRPRR